MATVAQEAKDWQKAASLWEELYATAVTSDDRLFAGRRAAFSYRHGGDPENARRIMRSLVSEFEHDRDTRRELARLQLSVDHSGATEQYWAKRHRFIYIHVVRELCQRIGRNVASVVDVGSHGTPILSWFPVSARRVSIDIRSPYVAPGIEAHEIDFLQWEPGERFDVGLCLQVLEHVEEAGAFAKKLLRLCDVTIVSVPYRWPETASRYHVHDPVDEVKLAGWFEREPNYSYKVAELDGQERLIAIYDRDSRDSWSNVHEDYFLYRWTLRGSEALLTHEQR